MESYGGERGSYPPPYSGSMAQEGGYPPVYGHPQPQPQGYPPHPQGYPQPQGYPPSVGFNQPSQMGAGYPPPQGAGYPPPQGGGYPPSQGPYSSYQPAGYPPNPHSGMSYPPPTGGYSQPPQSSYPPPSQTSGYALPVMTQPSGGTDGWMNTPQSRPVNCPPGLEYLTTLDQLLVKQKVEILEALIGFETKNKFTVKNSLGQKVFYAVEQSGCLSRLCCGPIRPFGMKILDNFKNEVIHLERPLACDSCWFPCCLQKMEVYSPPGCLVGSIEQNWSILTPSFSIKNGAGDVILKIEGPFCTFSFCGDVEFKILALDGNTVVGKITKQWAGLLREAFTDADYFGITFPMDLDVKMKAVMLGACFLIDAMFFEKSGNEERDRPGMF